MAKKQRDPERATEPRDTDPSMGADDRVEEIRGTADTEDDEFEEGDEDEGDDAEEEEDEGTF